MGMGVAIQLIHDHLTKAVFVSNMYFKYRFVRLAAAQLLFNVNSGVKLHAV